MERFWFREKLDSYGKVEGPPVLYFGSQNATGNYVFYSEAIEEIEKRDKIIVLASGKYEEEIAELKREIAVLRLESQTVDRVGGYYRADYVEGLQDEQDALKKEIATLISLIEEQVKVIAELRERLNKSWEREDIQGNDVLKLHLKVAEKDQVSAELKRQHFQVTKKLNEDIEFYAHQKNLNGQLLKESQAKLSRLTAALEDDARAEKVLLEGKWPMGEYGRQEAINDYRADLKGEVEG